MVDQPKNKSIEKTAEPEAEVKAETAADVETAKEKKPVKKTAAKKTTKTASKSRTKSSKKEETEVLLSNAEIGSTTQIKEKIKDSESEEKKPAKKRVVKKTAKTTAKTEKTENKTAAKTTVKKAAKTTAKSKAKTVKAEEPVLPLVEVVEEAEVKTEVKKAKKTTAKKTAARKTKKEETDKTEAKPVKKTTRRTKKSENVDKSEITDFNKYLFHQGKNYNAYEFLGAHATTRNNKQGIQFATWAPNAKDIYVVGDFNDFELKDEYKLKKQKDSGIWDGFFTDAKVGDKYKFCIIDQEGSKSEFKADPYAFYSELRPGNASVVYTPKAYKWHDKKWITKRNSINPLESAINIYEIHLGSWKRNEDGTFLTYEQISELLPQYLVEMGYTHVEIMPIVEHPLDASWGYQATGYYSPTSRYGTPEGLKKLIDKLHENNIGVILDWVPGHFCRDAHGLYKFDGTPTYEYSEEWKAGNKDWGTSNFDLGKPEVQSYLISNALYWYREFHIDGLRVDAVSSILYLDYSKQPWEWKPNKYGGNGNLEAIDFLKQLNQAVFTEYPTALMIAEESTAWPNVTKPPMKDGLGFNFKWNMGWMNDNLEYIKIDPLYRKDNHSKITFAMMYNYAENYILPLSHDEVVHGKASLIEKMWGDEWNKYAGLRAFMGYMMAHPGKKLTFMGCEFAQGIEWREYEELEWNLIEDIEYKKQTHLFFKDLNHLYLDNKALWQLDHDYRGFSWIEPDNNQQSILIFTRRSVDDDDTLVFVVNFTSKVYYDYKIGVPFNAEYDEIFNTDDKKYGGSGQIMGETLYAEKDPFHNQPYSIKIKVPPMATLVLKVKNIKKEETEDSDLNVQDDNSVEDK